MDVICIMWAIITGRPAKRSHAGIIFAQWSKNGFFAPHGRLVASQM